MNNVLVLNADFSPLNITSLQRGFVLVDKGKAEIVKKGEKDIVTTIGNFVRPVIIRLLNYILIGLLLVLLGCLVILKMQRLRMLAWKMLM